LANGEIGWNKMASFSGGIFSAAKYEWMDNLSLYDYLPGRRGRVLTRPGNERSIKFPDLGVYYWDDSRDKE
jgi:hypothetical protein